jgi:hypothetical protein
MMKKPQVYPLRYAVDFFGVSNEVAVELSKCATGDQFHYPPIIWYMVPQPDDF